MKQRLRACQNPGLHIDPPPRERRLFRVVHVIDIGAANPREAAQAVHQIMRDPDSLAPVLHVLDHRSRVVTLDLARSQTRRSKRRGKTEGGAR